MSGSQDRASGTRNTTSDAQGHPIIVSDFTPREAPPGDSICDQQVRLASFPLLWLLLPCGALYLDLRDREHTLPPPHFSSPLGGADPQSWSLGWSHMVQ